MRPTKVALRNHYDPLFPDFQTDYPDQLRADEVLREFDEFVVCIETIETMIGERLRECNH
jgi:hypothetical protein